MKLTERQVEILLDALQGHESVIDAREVEDVSELARLIAQAGSVELAEGGE